MSGKNGVRGDHRLVADLVEPGCRVLDIGCGDGELLHLMVREKQVDGRGIELSQAGVNACVARGLSVVQGDADSDLADYPDDAFDFVILSQTLQATRAPRVVLDQLLRIGSNVIVSFPNFGVWRNRLPADVPRSHAGDRLSAIFLVRHAEHPLLHDPGFRLDVRGDGRAYGQGDGA